MSRFPKSAPKEPELVLGFDPIELANAFEAFAIVDPYCPAGFINPQDIVQALSVYSPRRIHVTEATAIVSSLRTDSKGYVNVTDFIEQVRLGENRTSPASPPASRRVR